ncbi:hypothetical protein [Aeribacillus pallidus]|uniref:hypothetical protein n=1 Tax=Aeribacillus pallidus TaxID=33936 RepID=UPI001F3CCFBB|nr:hypothetical protein [Aeribacillus pallidus]
MITKISIFSAQAAFKQSFKIHLQERFLVTENKHLHGYTADLWVEKREGGPQYAIYLMNRLAKLSIKTKLSD